MKSIKARLKRLEVIMKSRETPKEPVHEPDNTERNPIPFEDRRAIQEFLESFELRCSKFEKERNKGE